MSNPTSALTMVSQINVGNLDQTTITLLDAVEPSTSTVAYVWEYPYSLTGSASNTTVALGTLCPVTNMQVLAILETTNPATGFSIAFDSAGTQLAVSNQANGAAGYLVLRSDGNAPPTVYLTNSNTTAVNIQFIVLGS